MVVINKWSDYNKIKNNDELAIFENSFILNNFKSKSFLQDVLFFNKGYKTRPRSILFNTLKNSSDEQFIKQLFINFLEYQIDIEPFRAVCDNKKLTDEWLINKFKRLKWL